MVRSGNPLTRWLTWGNGWDRGPPGSCQGRSEPIRRPRPGSRTRHIPRHKTVTFCSIFRPGMAVPGSFRRRPDRVNGMSLFVKNWRVRVRTPRFPSPVHSMQYAKQKGFMSNFRPRIGSRKGDFPERTELTPIAMSCAVRWDGRRVRFPERTESRPLAMSRAEFVNDRARGSGSYLTGEGRCRYLDRTTNPT